MPLYEYKCEACDNRFEKIVKFSDPPVETCPKCGGRVEKLLSSPAFQFKGSGWYVTDYAKKSSSEASSGKSASDKESSGTSDTKADSTKADSSANTATSSKDKS
jgi:putative FmdB family regulatory protein